MNVTIFVDGVYLRLDAESLQGLFAWRVTRLAARAQTFDDLAGARHLGWVLRNDRSKWAAVAPHAAEQPLEFGHHTRVAALRGCSKTAPLSRPAGNPARLKNARKRP